MRVFISCDLDLLTSQSMHADRLPQSIMCTKFAVDSSTVSQHGQTDRHTHTHTHIHRHIVTDATDHPIPRIGYVGVV